MPSTPWPAACTVAGPTPEPCRSRLAGKGARKPCIAQADAIAGKPAPTAGGAQCPTSSSSSCSL
ncbi:hypothetical protein CW358_14740 [Pseudomonas protegens]|nr:hypothetical protein CW358_14740 [Pseudomonas protegens]